MTTIESPTKTERTEVLPAENQKGIENHRRAAQHHEEAAKHHYEAARQHEAGNHEKASECTIKAQGHHILASEAEKEDVKHHAMNQ